MSDNSKKREKARESKMVDLERLRAKEEKLENEDGKRERKVRSETNERDKRRF